MSIAQNIKNYFNSKTEGIMTKKPLDGIYRNYWEKKKWESKFYTLRKGRKLVRDDLTYNSFINRIVESNVNGMLINRNNYECETCKIRSEQA